MTRTSDEIRAEVERLKKLPLFGSSASWHNSLITTRIAALEWVLTPDKPAEATPVTISDDEIFEAMRNAFWGFDDGPNPSLRAALAIAKPLIARQARDMALDEAAKLANRLHGKADGYEISCNIDALRKPRP